VLYAVSCLLGYLPEDELSNNNNQPSTSYALLQHDCFNILTNIDLIGYCIHSDTKPCLCIEL